MRFTRHDDPETDPLHQDLDREDGESAHEAREAMLKRHAAMGRPSSPTAKALATKKEHDAVPFHEDDESEESAYAARAGMQARATAGRRSGT